MTTDLDALLQSVAEATTGLERDELVPVELLTGLSERVRAAAPEIPAERGPELMAAWDALVQAAEGQRDRAGDHLKKLRSGRRALRGYAHLRGHTRGQRLNKSV